MKTWTDLRVVSLDRIGGVVLLSSANQPFEPRDIGQVLEIDLGKWRFRAPVLSVQNGIAYVQDQRYIPLTADTLTGHMGEGIGYPLGVWVDVDAEGDGMKKEEMATIDDVNRMRDIAEELYREPKGSWGDELLKELEELRYKLCKTLGGREGGGGVMPAIPNDLEDCQPMTLNDLILSLARVLDGNGDAEVWACTAKLGERVLRVRKVTVSAGAVCIWGDYRDP